MKPRSRVAFVPMMLCLGMLLLMATPCYVRAQTPAQDKKLVPQKTSDGILFQCVAPNATAVYLAGDFNGWADNKDGVITDSKFKMIGPDANGLWHVTVKMTPGDHQFKFCIDGQVDKWFTPEWVIEHDADGNAIIHVTQAGVPLLQAK